MTRALLLLALLASPPLVAEVPEAVPEALRPLAPLVGTRWIATFPGGNLTDEQRFEWVYSGRFLRNEHWVRDEKGTVVYAGETLYSWDPVAEQIAWWYWNTTGGTITGTMAPIDGGWLAEGVNRAPSGQTPKVRGVVRALTAESWESVQYFDREGSWVEQWTIVYRPASASPTEPGVAASPPATATGQATAPTAAQPPTQPAAQPPAQPTAKPPTFIVHFTTGPAWVEGKPFREQPHAGEHSANLQRLRHDGSLLVGARFAETGMVILSAPSAEEARRAIDADAAVQAGIFEYRLAELLPFYSGCVP